MWNKQNIDLQREMQTLRQNQMTPVDSQQLKEYFYMPIEITWTKCSERMPFRQEVIVTLVGNLKIPRYAYNRWNSIELKEQFLRFSATSRDFWKANILWTPYTPELWETLKCLLSE